VRRTALLLAAAAATTLLAAGAAPATALAPAASRTATAAPAPVVAAAAAPRAFLTAVTDRGSAPAWGTFRLVGKLSPARAGERIVVQRRLGSGPWAAFQASTVTRADGLYAIPMVSGRRGVNQFRTVRAAIAGRPTVVSNVTTITIR